jgi:DNA-binding IscR family transcriptional regulator
LRLAANSVELRRVLGPTAWAVFEELLLVSTSTPDGRQASMSVRSLAQRLGLAKDTVARALTRLRRAGLVTPIQSRTSAGAFGAGSYLLTIPDSITIQAVSRLARASRRSRSPQPRGSQLALAIDA